MWDQERGGWRYIASIAWKLSNQVRDEPWAPDGRRELIGRGGWKGCERDSDWDDGLGQEHWERAGITVKEAVAPGDA
jgi:hypothetical protein